MAAVRESPPMSLEEFLTLPDEKPYKEYIDGRIEVKMSPQPSHGVIQTRIAYLLDEFAWRRRLGRAGVEIRCEFAGRSIVPDVVFLSPAKIETDSATRRMKGNVRHAPDVMVEVLSPDQSRSKSRNKLAHAVANGCSLGWFVDPDRDVVEVFRPDAPPTTLTVGDVLTGGPILPGFELAVADVFSWLIL